MRSEYDFSKGQRGRYAGKIKPGDTDSRNCKVTVTIQLDADIVQHFKELAAESGSSFDNQINSILRDDIEPTEQSEPQSSLVDDDRFISAVAKRVADQLRESK
jgi:uncharacterized protein (DUF4415 family)